MGLEKIALLFFSFYCCNNLAVEYNPGNTVIAFDYHDVFVTMEYNSLIPKIQNIILETPLILGLIPNIFFWYDIVHLSNQKKSGEEIIHYLVKNYPILQTHESLLSNIAQDLRPIKGMHELAQSLRDQGYTLYLASNIGSESLVAQQKIYPELFSLFTDCYTPAIDGVKKPDIRYYQGLRSFINEYESNEPHIFFIDDSKKNIEGARISAQGIQAFHFTNADQLQKDLQKEGLVFNVASIDEIKI